MTLDIHIELDEQGVAREARLLTDGRAGSEAQDDNIITTLPLAMGGMFSQLFSELCGFAVPEEPDEKFTDLIAQISNVAAEGFAHGFKGFMGTDESCSFDKGDIIEGQQTLTAQKKEEDDE